MKIPDVNILIYAHDGSSPFHEKAHEWLAAAIRDSADPIGIAPAAALGFIRLICNPRIFQNPLSIPDGCKVVETWLDGGATWVDVGRDHFGTLKQLMKDAHGGLNLLADAHLAALAIEHRATLYSNDRDFARFKGLKVKNPIDGSSV